MTVSTDGQTLQMEKCIGIDRQIWTWKRKSPNGIIRASEWQRFKPPLYHNL